SAANAPPTPPPAIPKMPSGASGFRPASSSANAARTPLSSALAAYLPANTPCGAGSASLPTSEITTARPSPNINANGPSADHADASPSAPPDHWVDGWQRGPTLSLASWYATTERVALSRPSSGIIITPVLMSRVPSRFSVTYMIFHADTLPGLTPV